MATQPVYQSQDAKSSSYVSKGDSICFTQENKQYSATAVSISPNVTRVQLERSDRYTDVKNDTVSIKEKYKYSGSIPVEVNDLVVVNHDNEQITAIVIGVEAMKARIYLVGNQRQAIDVNISDLSYLAKGYVNWVPEDILRSAPSNLQNQGTNRYVAQTNNATTHQMDKKNYNMNQGQTNTYTNTQQMSNQNIDNNHIPPAVALLYPAPCVVMAVPHMTDPNSYPEAMSVHLPWSTNPTLLPVVRMGSGTVLVVVPPASPVTQMSISQGQVSQQNNTNQNQMNTSMQTMNMNNAQTMNMNANMQNTNHYQAQNNSNMMHTQSMNMQHKLQVKSEIKMENTNQAYTNAQTMKMNTQRTGMANPQQPMMNTNQANPMNQQVNLNTMPNNGAGNNYY